MSVWDGIQKQLRSVIQWENASPEALFELWSENGDEIKNASQLVVGPGQGCIFVYEGRVCGHFEYEGMYELSTSNIPFWTTVSNFMQAFTSEHKTQFFFYRKTKFLDQKWGTTSPVKYEDPKYKFPVGLRAFGNCSFRITEPKEFFLNVVGNSALYPVEDFRKIMVSRMAQPMTDYMAESRFSYAEIDANREEMASDLILKLSPDFAELGFEITDFRIEGTNFDDDTNERIGRIADMTAEAQAAAAVGLDYTQLKKLDAMQAAAENEGGAAGAGMGLGAGMGFGNMMAESMAGLATNKEANQNNADPVATLQKLKQMVEMDLISAEEYQNKKDEILKGM